MMQGTPENRDLVLLKSFSMGKQIASSRQKLIGMMFYV